MELETNKPPRIFATNLAELIVQQRRQEKTVRPYIRVTNKVVRFFGTHWFLWLNRSEEHTSELQSH